jgi:MerR family copper efflux transcriptional regulator
MLTIGRVAQQTGLTPKAVRLYETHGLIAPPARTASGYRTYQPKDLPVLRFIRQAQALGLTLKEIKTILDVRRGGRAPCALVAHLLDEHLAETERRIAELQELRAALRTTRAFAWLRPLRALTRRRRTEISPPDVLTVALETGEASPPDSTLRRRFSQAPD